MNCAQYIATRNARGNRFANIPDRKSCIPTNEPALFEARGEFISKLRIGVLPRLILGVAFSAPCRALSCGGAIPRHDFVGHVKRFVGGQAKDRFRALNFFVAERAAVCGCCIGELR